MVKFGALVFVLGLDTQDAINFQLLGGVWILQTMPALVFALYTRWFHRWALLAGWAVGHGLRHLDRLPASPVAGKPGSHFGGPLALVPFTDTKGYIALTAFVHQRAGGRGADLRVPGPQGRRRASTRPRRPTTTPTPATAGVEDVLEGEPGTAPTTR